MAVVSNALFLTILVLFLGQGLGLLPDVPSSNGGVPTPSTVPSNLPRIMGIGCQTSSNDVDIHPLIAKQLSQQFCDELRGQRLGTGLSFTSPKLPTDLAQQSSGPNYTTIEASGVVVVFSLLLGDSFINENGTIRPQGQQSQCDRDDCHRIFDAIVNRCQWNSHYFGGYNQDISESGCGTYTVYTINCTNNLVNPDCKRFHNKWQPEYTTTSSSSRALVKTYTNTDHYDFTLTQSATTITSGVLVSTLVGADGPTIVPMIFTVDGTFTGYTPNPTFDGPTFSPRFSSVASTSSSRVIPMNTKTGFPFPTISGRPPIARRDVD